MKIPNEIRKCVVFIGLQKANGEFQFAGTGLLFVYAISRKPYWYILTAKHIINGIKNKGVEKVFYKVNFESGNSDWKETFLHELVYA